MSLPAVIVTAGMFYLLHGIAFCLFDMPWSWFLFHLKSEKKNGIVWIILREVIYCKNFNVAFRGMDKKAIDLRSQAQLLRLAMEVTLDATSLK